MWLNRPNLASLAFLIGLVGSISMAATSFWSAMPTAIKHRCRDNITIVKGSLEGAECDPDQTLSYMQDFSGEKYIICRCTADTVEEVEPETPIIPDLMIPPESDIPETPKIDSKKDGMLL